MNFYYRKAGQVTESDLFNELLSQDPNSFKELFRLVSEIEESGTKNEKDEK